MSSCSRYQNLFSAHLDGMLKADERLKLQEHLTRCGDCHQALDGLKQMVSALNSLPSPEAPDLLPAIHARLSAAPARGSLSIWPFSLSWHSLALAMSVLLVVAVVGLPRFLKKQTTVSEPAKKSAAPSVLTSAGDGFASRAAGGGGLLGYVSAKQRQDFDTQEPLVNWREENAPSESGEYVESVSAGLDEMRPASAPVGFSADSHLRLNKTMQAAGFVGSAGVRQQTKEKTVEDMVGIAWHVSNAQEAMLAVNAWVESRHGTVKPVGKYQLSVLIPSFELPEFLRRFSDGSSEPLDVPAGSFWVTVFLEIIPQD